MGLKAPVNINPHGSCIVRHRQTRHTFFAACSPDIPRLGLYREGACGGRGEGGAGQESRYGRGRNQRLGYPQDCGRASKVRRAQHISGITASNFLRPPLGFPPWHSLGFPSLGFPWVSLGFPLVFPLGFPLGFPWGSLRVSLGFPRASLGFPSGFPRVSLGFPSGFPRGSLGFPSGFPRVTLGFRCLSFSRVSLHGFPF